MQIDLKNVTVRFKDSKNPLNEVVAVDNLDLVIPDGKLICLLGPSGCGKSTTLYAIAGLQQLTEGQVFFGDKDVTHIDATQRGIGLVFQNYSLYPHMTVRDNIAFPLKNSRWKKEDIEKRILEVAKMVQIEQQLDRKPAQLSGGQQQRVAIARAIAKNPHILLMDEPLSNLDAKLRHSTREEIRRIQKTTGFTTVFVTHDQEEAMTISDQIVILKDGKLQQIGGPQEVYENPANLFVAGFIGSPTMNFLDVNIKNSQVMFNGIVLGDTKLGEGNYTLGVRPESVDPVEPGQTGIPAKVRTVEILGREIVYRLELVGQVMVTMITPIEVQLREDEDLQVAFVPRRCYLFDPNTELLIERI